MRGKVDRILEEHLGDMAMKTYPQKRICDRDGEADLAMAGYRTLLQVLPAEEHELLVPIYVDSAQQRAFAPLLNKNQRVIGMGQNFSKDRESLKGDKLPNLQNFERTVARLLDAFEHVGKKGFVLGADTCLLTINDSTREFGYRYGDYEAIGAEREPVPLCHVAPSNILDVAVSLKAFLHECVQNPDTYLRSLHTEAIRRLNAYKGIDADIDVTINILEENEWPEPTLKEQLKAALSWMRNSLKT